MNLLKERIEIDGIVLNESILKVDSFINHQIDPKLAKEIGKEFVNRFKNKKIDKILTIETSGVAFGLMTALEMNIDLVFAKKAKPSTMSNDNYYQTVKSFTKNTDYTVTVDKKYLKAGENILIIDDFLAHGNAAKGLCNMVNEANANIIGIGIVIEKGFQEGGTILRKEGYKVESLAIINDMKNNHIKFK